MAGGKRVRGLTATKTYEAFVEPEKLTPVNLKLAAILGITMEMVSRISHLIYVPN